jgi:DNA ligase-1
MTKIFRPMLSAIREDSIPLPMPCLVSTKLDGIRMMTPGGHPQTRSGKPPANKRVDELMAHPLLANLDGELIAGAANAEDVFNRTTRVVARHDAPINDLTFHVFDWVGDPELPFKDRLEIAEERVVLAAAAGLPVLVVPHFLVRSELELEKTYLRFLAEGYEGAMVRHPEGQYKNGRSTARQGWLTKIKPFVDAEAVITAFEEVQHNENAQERDELGFAKRSSAKAGQVGGNTLGALTVRSLETGVEFSIGSGFTASQRGELWADRTNLIGKIVTYKSMTVGVVDKPRHPVFLRLRDGSDIEAAA